MHPIRAVLGVAVVAALSIACVGCGDSSDSTVGVESTASTSPTPAPSGDPGDPDDPADATSCESVWVEGSDLPAGYHGCTADGTAVAPEVVECSSGQRIVTYDDRYWALRGHVIGYAPDGLSEDKAYGRVLYSCRA